MQEKDRSAAERILSELRVEIDMRMLEWCTLILKEDLDWGALESLDEEMQELERMLEALEVERS
jgi:hypothetical protein